MPALTPGIPASRGALDLWLSLDSLISRFKHQGKWPLGHLLASLLGQCLQDRFDNAELARPDRLLPVPMAAKRLRQRGYNQATMLARWLGRDLDLPVDEQLLLRPRTPSPNSNWTPGSASATCSRPLPWPQARRYRASTWRWWTMC